MYSFLGLYSNLVAIAVILVFSRNARTGLFSTLYTFFFFLLHTRQADSELYS